MGTLWAAAVVSVAIGAGATPGYHILINGRSGVVVRWALDGARRRLAAPECRQLFDDFTDRGGRPLALDVAATGTDPATILAGLYFADGRDEEQCQASEALAAFTFPGSRVVHVCSQRFVLFARKPGLAEILLIHELLHALGLGENPPTSGAITRAVMKRCGDAADGSRRR